MCIRLRNNLLCTNKDRKEWEEYQYNSFHTNHLLFVLGKPVDDIPIKELIKITPFYSSSVSNKDGVLNYDVIKVGGSND